MKPYVALFLGLFLGAFLSTEVMAGSIKAGAFQQKDLLKYFESINKNVLNHAVTPCGLTTSSTTGKIKTTATINYTIDGVFYSLSSSSNIGVTVSSTQAVSRYCKYLVSVDANGAFTTTKGTDAGSSTDAVLPNLPDASTAVGYFEIQTSASATFLAGTTAFNAAGITATFKDIGAMKTGKYKMDLLNR